MPKQLNTEIFINKANTIHNNKYSYFNYKYVNAHIKSIIICPHHGEFLQSPNCHLNGRGCPKCGLSKIKDSQKKDKNSVINQFINIHKNKYDYSKFIYQNNRTKSIIICPEHGEFLQDAHDHMKGIGCPKCGVIKRSFSRKLGKNNFIEKANKIHNDKYNYSKINYINNSTKIEIICNEHGSFFQIPNAHLNGCGCPTCSKEILKQKISNRFIENVKKIHNNKYDYSNTIYISISKKICIICPKHGKFYQLASNHYNGQGCYKCGREQCAKKCSKSHEKFIKETFNIHHNQYDYSSSNYKNANTKIEIICKEHGRFWQTPHHHLRGNGCPKCFKIISKKEIEFINHLNIPNTKENRQVNIFKKRVDGYIPETQTIYEFLGDFWHGNPNKFNSDDINPFIKKTYNQLYVETFSRFNKLKQNGYIVKYIWESDWENFKKRIDSIPKILTY